MEPQKPTVFIIDDDPTMRDSIALLMKSVGIATRTFESASEFLDTYFPDQPGCLVLDVRMPGMSGLDLQNALNFRGAIIPVIFVTGHGDIPMAVEAMQQGAFDFLEKPFRDQVLLQAVQRALASDAENRNSMAKHELNRARLEALTPREQKVLALMTRGISNKVMAVELGMSQRTLKMYRARVMKKSGAHSLAQLVRMVMDSSSGGQGGIN